MAEPVAPRIATLDIVRGVAVLGILAMNIVAFAMPPSAYINPLAYGTESAADLWSYSLSFLFVDGKMRGLFSFLFGASLLLVTQGSGSEEQAEFARRRLFWLLLFGLFHFYFVWFGDILVGYALIGFLALLFRHRSVRSLIIWATVLILVQLLIFAGSTTGAYAAASAVSVPNPSPQAIEAWDNFARDMGVPTPARLSETMALYRGSYSDLLHHQLTEKTIYPLVMTVLFGPETLAYMLLGMAGLKSGFLTGAWDDRRYRRAALIGLGISLPLMAALLWLLFRDEFSVPALFAWSFTGTVPVRPLMVIAYAALIILATRRGGWLTERLAAAGRAAFSNYLGTSILMTAFFYGWGLGQFGAWSRAELWLVVLAMWAVMLAWPKPWLEQFRYGPLEWLWRSLSRWRLEPLRRPAVTV